MILRTLRSTRCVLWCHQSSMLCPQVYVLLTVLPSSAFVPPASTVLLRQPRPPIGRSRSATATATDDGEPPETRQLTQADGSPRAAVLGAYSWSVSRLSTSQETVRDAYSWSVEMASNSSPAVWQVLQGVQVSQFPALLPRWLTSRVKRVATPDVEGEPEPSTSKESEPAGLEPPTPKRYIETVVGAGKRLYVIALAFAFALEVTGPLALALCLQTLVVRQPGPATARTMIHRGILSVWLASEAVFYCVACAIALCQNVMPGRLGGPPFGRSHDREWRRSIWRRILDDPSQTPRDFVEGWMYRSVGDGAQASPPQMLLKWAAEQRAAGSTAALTAAADSRGRLLAEPRGVPYEELSRADIEHWLCRALFARRRTSQLTRNEAEELAEYVDELEAAVSRVGRVGAAIDLGKGIVGSAVSESRTAVQRVAEATNRLRRLAPGRWWRRHKSINRSYTLVNDTATSRAAGTIIGPRFSQTLAALTSRWRRGERQGPTPRAISSMCASMDMLRWRHRPLLFYMLTHLVACFLTPIQMRRRGFVRHREGPITYWYRAGTYGNGTRTRGDARKDSDASRGETNIDLDGTDKYLGPESITTPLLPYACDRRSTSRWRLTDSAQPQPSPNLNFFAQTRCR